MATLSAGGPCSCETSVSCTLKNPKKIERSGRLGKAWMILIGLVFFATLAVAQGAPQITAIDPANGKVNDTVTVSGTDLGKATVSSVFLSDDKMDYKAAIVDQSDDKITVKVPQVKPGDYNVSIQVGDKLFIKPVKFKVEQ
jgi:IPT/TIG domain